MYKNLFVSACMSLLLVGCAAEQPVVVEPVPQQVTVEARTWTIHVPRDWEIAGAGDNVKLSDPAGEVLVTVTALPLEDVTAEKFGEAVVMEATQNEDLDILDAFPKIISGHTGSRFVAQHEAVIMIYNAVGVDDLGYITSCSYLSDVTLSEVNKRCDEILSTFRVSVK